jgi:hypothetical protein
MAEQRDGRAPFDYFMENVNRLLADQHFREVLRELDEGKKETLSLLASDPTAFLRYRGVQIPQDFRISVKKPSKMLLPTSRSPAPRSRKSAAEAEGVI